MKIRKLTAAVAASIAAHGAVAQPVLEEVIVTAQKRAESVQDVPSTVNVLQGDALKNFNVFNFTDLENLTSGLTINKDTGRSGSIVLRGINFDPNSVSEAAVTVYWNDALVDGNAVFQQMFDVERVEVLRGPQGTLQGRSSPAGAINIHTAKPDMEVLTGQIKATVQDNDGFNTQFGISIPLIEGVLAARVAGVYDESDLNEVKNIATGNLSHEESKAGRMSISWLPSDSLSLDLVYQYLENDVDAVSVLHGVPIGDPFLDPEGILTPLDAFDKRGIAVAGDTTNADYNNTTFALNWEMPGHLLTAITGYHETNSTRIFDRAEGNLNPGNILLRIPEDNREDFSQELRLSSEDTDFWEYMVGVYYENSKVEFQQDNFLRPDGPFSPADQVLLFPVETDRYGVFTHNKFYLTDSWTAQLGLRWQKNEAQRDITLVAGQEGFPPEFQPGDLIQEVLTDDNQKDDSDAVTGAANLQYTFPNNDMATYLNFTTGWRPGGVTVGAAVLPEDLLLFGEEDSTSLELGFKSTIWDERLRLNGAIFFQEFDNYIARVNGLNVRSLQPDGSLGTRITQNGVTSNADAEIWGAEIEFDTLVTQNWTAGGSISYIDASFKSGESLPCNQFDDAGNPFIPEGEAAAVCDVGGDPMSSQPDWSLSLNSEYTLPLGQFDGFVRVLYRYAGQGEHAELGKLDSYNVFNLYLGVRSENWDVSLYANNLFDEEAIRGGRLTLEPIARRSTGYGRRNILTSRVYGLSVSYNF